MGRHRHLLAVAGPSCSYWLRLEPADSRLSWLSRLTPADAADAGWRRLLAECRSAGAQARLLTRARTALMGAQGLFHPWRLPRFRGGDPWWSPSQSAFFARHGHPTRQHGSFTTAPSGGAAHREP